MKENNFVYADLSTYNLDTTKKFYSNVFGWKYYNSGENYFIAYSGDKETTGLYETPKKFQEMNMPSFWMSYIQVNSVEKTVEKAKELGGIIELVDLNSSIGKIALIRDPLGAGFTIYEGDKLNSRTKDSPNTLVWNELFISDLSKVKPFYEGIFRWKIQVNNDTHQHFILNTKGEKIGAILEVDNLVKGKYEYWGIFIAVDDVENTKRKAINSGGSLVYEDQNVTVLADSFGAFFHVISTKKEAENTTNDDYFPWKATLGILIIISSLMTGWYWLWGVFFLFWAITDINSGITYMLEPIEKSKQPTFYWIVVITWISLSILSLYYYSSF